MKFYLHPIFSIFLLVLTLNCKSEASKDSSPKLKSKSKYIVFRIQDETMVDLDNYTFENIEKSKLYEERFLSNGSCLMFTKWNTEKIFYNEICYYWNLGATGYIVANPEVIASEGCTQFIKDQNEVKELIHCSKFDKIYGHFLYNNVNQLGLCELVADVNYKVKNPIEKFHKDVCKPKDLLLDWTNEFYRFMNSVKLDRSKELNLNDSKIKDVIRKFESQNE